MLVCDSFPHHFVPLVSCNWISRNLSLVFLRRLKMKKPWWLLKNDHQIIFFPWIENESRDMVNEYPAITLIIQILEKPMSHPHLYLFPSPLTWILILCWSGFEHEILCIQFRCKQMGPLFRQRFHFPWKTRTEEKENEDPFVRIFNFFRKPL